MNCTSCIILLLLLLQCHSILILDTIHVHSDEIQMIYHFPVVALRVSVSLNRVSRAGGSSPGDNGGRAKAP